MSLFQPGGIQADLNKIPGYFQLDRKFSSNLLDSVADLYNRKQEERTMGRHNKQKTKITLSMSPVAYLNLASSTSLPKFGSQCLQTHSQFLFKRTACLLFFFYMLLNMYYIPSAQGGTFIWFIDSCSNPLWWDGIPFMAVSVILYEEKFNGIVPNSAFIRALL